jgi:hypothetical protein
MRGLTRDEIESGGLVEGQTCDFKSRLDLSEAKTKADLIDDVVAFLNRGEGRIVVGVDERSGAFAQYRPLTGDPDAFKLRVQSILQDSITPTPFDIVVDSLTVEDGYLLDIRIPAHSLRPYQNKITGSFQIRTGVKNRVLDRDAVEAMFEAGRRQEQDLLALVEGMDAALASENLLQTNGPSLTVSILPQAHYDRSRAPFHRGHGFIKSGPLFNDGRGIAFKGCQDGHEAISLDFNGKVIERLFVSDTWFLHAHIVHPISVSHGVLKLHEFRDDLAAYLSAIQGFLESEAVGGPHCVLISLRDLHRSDIMARIFPKTRTITLPRPVRTDRLDAGKLAEQMFALAERSSIFA